MKLRKKITANRKVMASRNRVDGYAVKIHNYRTACYDLLLFDSKSDAVAAYQALEDLSYGADQGMYDEDEFNFALEDIFNSADEYVEEIDFRRAIDDNDVWTAGDDTRWQIVNPSAVGGISI